MFLPELGVGLTRIEYIVKIIKGVRRHINFKIEGRE